MTVSDRSCRLTFPIADVGGDRSGRSSESGSILHRGLPDLRLILRSWQRFQRATRSGRGRTQHMRVDHRGADIAMPKQLLHTTNIYPRVEQVRRERVPQGVGSDFLRNSSKRNGAGDRPADSLLILMMSATNFGARVDGQCGRREDPVPSQALRRPWKFPGQCIWKPNPW